MTEHHVIRFAPGTVVSAGEYRNLETGVTRYFDGQTPLPGGPNSSAWQQVSDHYHAQKSRSHSAPDMVGHGVRFGPGTVVSAGEYRNTDTGAIRYFDGATPIPGSANSAAWQQVSDHYHAQETHTTPSHATGHVASHSVRFAPGTVVSPGEYRNCETGAVRFFDGNTPLPGGVNASAWQQISDHYHPQQD